MRTKLLSSKYEMPTLGLGTWLAAPGEVFNIVKSAIKSGYRHIDCAFIYQNEEEIGRALTEVFSEGIVKREELFVTSKLWNDSHAPEHVPQALQKSLSELKLDYLDLYLIHWPVAFKKGISYSSDPADYVALEKLPLMDTYSELEKGVDQGLIKSIGVSNFSKKKLDHIYQNARIKPAVNQVELHPYLQQNDLLSYCKENQIALTGYSPLGSGGRPAEMLTGDEVWILENSDVKEIAAKHGKSPAQVILNWAMSRGTAVIPKTVNPTRAVENFQSQDFELDGSDMEKIASLDKHYRYLNGEFFTPEGSPYTIAELWDE